MSFAARACLVTTAAALAVLGSGAPASAIANGDPVASGQYAFTARLTMTGIPTGDGGARDSWCSGALIAPRWVITAGHCFRDSDGTRVSRTVAASTVVTIGRTDLTGSKGQQAGIAAVRQSPETDVALVELDREVTGITPLAISRTPPAPGETVRLTGFGLTSPDGTAPKRLQTGRFVVDSAGPALISLSGQSPRADTSACLHDSGGPYFQESGDTPELVAVVSSGPTCPHEGADQGARVDAIAGWITTTMNGTESFAGAAAVVAVALLTIVAVAVPVTRRRRSRRAPEAAGWSLAGR